MLQGKKTWIGLVSIILGWLGFGDLISEDQMAILIDSVLQIVGIVTAVYGNWDVHKREKQLRESNK